MKVVVVWYQMAAGLMVEKDMISSCLSIGLAYTTKARRILCLDSLYRV